MKIAQSRCSLYELWQSRSDVATYMWLPSVSRSFRSLSFPAIEAEIEIGRSLFLAPGRLILHSGTWRRCLTSTAKSPIQTYQDKTSFRCEQHKKAIQISRWGKSISKISYSTGKITKQSMSATSVWISSLHMLNPMAWRWSTSKLCSGDWASPALTTRLAILAIYGYARSLDAAHGNSGHKDAVGSMRDWALRIAEALSLAVQIYCLRGSGWRKNLWLGKVGGCSWIWDHTDCGIDIRFVIWLVWTVIFFTHPRAQAYVAISNNCHEAFTFSWSYPLLWRYSFTSRVFRSRQHATREDSGLSVSSLRRFAG